MLFFIINPVAGHGRSVRVMDKLCTVLNARGVAYDTAFSQRAGHTVDIARKAGAKGYDAIISVGGDGTLREILEGTYGSDTVLGVIPAGTGNDFIKSLGIPKDPIEALEIILNGHRRTVDAGKINRRMFLNVANLGFDAQVVETSQNIPLLRGLPAYFLATIITLFKLKLVRAELEHEDGSTTRHEVLLVAICNGAYYGGGFHVAPPARLDDGLLDVVLAERFSRLRVLSLLPSYIRGTHLKKNLRGLSHHTCTRLTIKTQEPVPANADGEGSKETALTIQVLPSAVTILAPGANNAG